jgi:catechol 2,3-dioxygenase-like lactoylglutathione lyase family enzyme
MTNAKIDAALVRYQVRDVERSIAFYAGSLGFHVDRRSGPFVQVSRGALVLVLSGPGTSGARDMPDGRTQEPGGWNRIIVWVEDLAGSIMRLRDSGATFRNEVETGPGGSQILVEDPDGNPVELHQAP